MCLQNCLPGLHKIELVAVKEAVLGVQKVSAERAVLSTSSAVTVVRPAFEIKVCVGLSEHRFWTGYLMEGKSLGPRCSVQP